MLEKNKIVETFLIVIHILISQIIHEKQYHFAKRT